MKILRSLISFSLLTAIILQVFGKLFVLADYTINKEYITKVLCINKNNPKMHCNGKCHLKKQLQKEDRKEQSPANPIKEVKDFQPYFANTFAIEPFTNYRICNLNPSNFLYSFHFSQQHLQAVFHPPCA